MGSLCMWIVAPVSTVPQRLLPWVLFCYSDSSLSQISLENCRCRKQGAASALNSMGQAAALALIRNQGAAPA